MCMKSKCLASASNVSYINAWVLMGNGTFPPLNMVVGELGTRQLDPVLLGPGAQLSALKKWTVGDPDS